MKLQLVKNIDKFILLSDEEIKEGDYTYNLKPLFDNPIGKRTKEGVEFEKRHPLANFTTRKIIASEHPIEGIPQLDLTQTFECKGEQLTLTEYWDKYRSEVDVEKFLTEQIGELGLYQENKIEQNIYSEGYEDGFNKSQELNADKKWSDDDVRWIIIMAISMERSSTKYDILEQMKRVPIDVEIDMEVHYSDKHCNNAEHKPKITRKAGITIKEGEEYVTIKSIK